MIPPHRWTPEEEAAFRPRMGLPLRVGMHVCDILYPHPGECGGSLVDSVVVRLDDTGTGVGTVRLDGTGASGSSVRYWVPKIEHMETFFAVMDAMGLTGPDLGLDEMRLVREWDEPYGREAINRLLDYVDARA